MRPLFQAFGIGVAAAAALGIGVAAAAALVLSIAAVGARTETGDRAGLGGGETYIRRSAWVSVICWVDGNGTLGCWPDELTGRDGFPTGAFETVRVGEDHLCARRSGGEVVCWGWGDCGQEECESPTGSFEVIRAGIDANCGRLTDGSVHCWGDGPSSGEELQ